MARRRREKEHGIFRELLGWLVYILIIIGLSYLIITYVGQRTMVSGTVHGAHPEQRRQSDRG